MATRTIKKNLAGEEDILFGEGTVIQTRNDASYNITKVRTVKPVNSLAELNALDTAKFTKAALFDSSKGTVTFYQYSEGSGLWEAQTFSSETIRHTQNSVDYLLSIYLQNRHAYNVLDYNADNTGATETWQQIQATIDACPAGGTVFIPDGTYSFGTGAVNKIVISKSITVRCEKGTVLKKDTPQGGIVQIDDCVNVEWYGGLLEHDRSPHASPGNTLTVRGCGKVKFFGLQMLNAGKDCAYLGESITDPVTHVNDGIYFNDCEFIAGRRQGISIIAGRSIYFDNCLFKDIAGDPPEAGVDIEANAGQPNPTEHIYFTNCKFINLVNNGGIFNATGQYVGVTNCEFRDCAFGVHVASVNANLDYQDVTVVTNVTNTITVPSHGLSVGDLVTISNRTYETPSGSEGTMPTGLTAFAAYRVYSVPSVNEFTLSTYYGHQPISFTDDGALPLFLGEFRQDRAANTIVDSCHFSNTSSYAVYGEVGFDMVVSNNTVVTSTGALSTIGLNNIDRAIVANNSIRGISSEGIYLSGADGQIVNNTILGNSQSDEGIRCFGGHNVNIEGNKMIDCGNTPGVVMNIRYFDEGSIIDNQVEDRSGFSPALCLDMNGSDSRYNVIDNNNFYNSCASDGGTLFDVDDNYNFVGDNNVVNSGAKYTGHIRSNTSELNSITADINTFGKYEGKLQFDQILNKTVYATGSTAGAVWVDSSGTTTHTPV